MSNRYIVWVFAGCLLLVGALQQIGAGLYYLGCFRRYNRIIDTFAHWFETVDPAEAAETIRNFVLISVALTLLIAVVI